MKNKLYFKWSIALNCTLEKTLHLWKIWTLLSISPSFDTWILNWPKGELKSIEAWSQQSIPPMITCIPKINSLITFINFFFVCSTHGVTVCFFQLLNHWSVWSLPWDKCKGQGKPLSLALINCTCDFVTWPAFSWKGLDVNSLSCEVISW